MTEYNGWHNRETWATMLHINNDPALYEIAMDYARTARDEHRKDDEANPEANVSFAMYCLQDTIEHWINEDLLTRENIAGNEGLWLMLSDIGSLYRVEWREIAESLMETVINEEQVSA